MAATLASISDVRRVLRITSVDANQDAQLTAALDTAEDWFRLRARSRYNVSGPSTAKFHEVSEHAVLHLPVKNSTVTAVRVGAPGFLRTLDSNEYIVMDDERIRLRSGFYWPTDGQLSVEESRASASNTVVEVVEVDYTPPATVPATVRDGIARLAASLWLSTGGGELGVSGITKEKIGDYSYEIGLLNVGGGNVTGSADDMKADAMQLLRPHIGARVSVT